MFADVGPPLLLTTEFCELARIFLILAETRLPPVDELISGMDCSVILERSGCCCCCCVGNGGWDADGDETGELEAAALSFLIVVGPVLFKLREEGGVGAAEKLLAEAALMGMAMGWDNVLFVSVGIALTWFVCATQIWIFPLEEFFKKTIML